LQSISSYDIILKNKTGNRVGIVENRARDGYLQEKITSIFLGALLIVFLFFCGFEGYAGITQPKFRAFCALSGAYILCMAAVALWKRLTGRAMPVGEALRRSSWAQRAVAAYVGVTWVSAVCSAYWPSTFVGVSRYEGALTLTLYGAVFLLVSMYGRVGRWLLWVLAGALSLFSLLCLVQMTGLNPLGLYPVGYSYLDAGKAYSGAYLGTLGNVDLVAAFYSLVVPILLYVVLRSEGRLRFLLLLPLGLSVWAVAAMGVSAGYLGVGAGCVLAFPAAGLREKKQRVLAGCILGGMILAALAVVYFCDMGTGMLHEAHQLLHGDFESSFGSGRVHIWQEVLGALPAHPLLGAGPDTMLLAELTPFTRYDAASGSTIVGQIDVAHNEYLNILFHQGPLALAAYLAMLGSLSRRWLRAAPGDAVTAALGAGIAGYCVQALFGFSMCITAPFFWVALGLLEHRTKIRKNS